MKKLNVLVITGLILLFTCATALAFNYGASDGSGSQSQPVIVEDIGQDTDPVAPVPEPTTMLLLGSGLAVLAVGARKRKK